VEIATCGSTPDGVSLSVDPVKDMAGLMGNGSFLLAGQFGPYVLASVPIEDVNFPDDQSRDQFEHLVRRQVCAYALTCVAGDAAQEMAEHLLDDGIGAETGEPAKSATDALREPHSDEDHLAVLVEKVSDKHIVEGFISWAYDKAARVVEANWEAIEALATALEERRRLDRDDLNEILPQGLWRSELKQAA
jgi:hypothetical protein